jgi:catecholate siderophore receptor
MRRLRRSVLKASRNPRRTPPLACTLLAPGLGLGLLLAAAGGAAAQSPSEPVPLSPLDVQAEQPSPYRPAPEGLKLPGNVKDIPQSTTILPEKLLEEQYATSLRDALRNVTGISLQAGEGGGPQGDNLTLRGYSVRTDIFVDSVRDGAQYTRDIFNYESIEVLKGPSAIFFGRGATGGVINQVTKTPKKEAFYEITGSLTNGPAGRLTVDVNQPLAPTLALRLNAMFNEGDPVGRDETHFQRYGFAPSLAWGIGTDTKLTLSYLYYRENNIPDYGLPVLLNNPPDVDRSNFYGLPDHDFEKTNTHMGTVTFDHRFNEHIRLHSILRYADYERRIITTAPRIAGSPTQATPLENIAVTRNRPGRELDESILAFQTDAQFTFDTGPLKHRVVTGLDVSHQSIKQASIVSSAVPTTLLTNPDPDVVVHPTRTQGARFDASATSVGIYAVDEIQILSWLKIMGGLRWDWFEANVHNVGAAGERTNFGRTDTMLAPRTALIVQPTPEQTYYFAYGESFNPSAEQLSTVNLANEDLDPERNRSFELGAKWELFKGALGINAALFRIERTNARTTDPDNPLFQVLAGNTRSDGAEVGVVGRILPGVNVFAGYTYLDTEIIEASDGTEGNELANAPHHTASLWATYDFLRRWQVGTGVFYSGKRFANNQNTSRVPGYVRWDATIAYQVTKNVALRFNILNIMDTTYFDRLHLGHVVPGDGRTFVLTGNFRF